MQHFKTFTIKSSFSFICHEHFMGENVVYYVLFFPIKMPEHLPIYRQKNYGYFYGF